MIIAEGNTRKTVGQIKELFTDLPSNLQERLVKCITSMLDDSLPFVYHAAHTAIAKQIKPTYDVVKSIEDGEYSVIEANIVHGKELRALIRSDKQYYSVKRECNVNLCLVVSITSQCIVTVYENSITDCHSTLDSQRYISQLTKYVISDIILLQKRKRRLI